MKWEIRYYLTESAFKSGISSFTEMVQGDRSYVITWAQNRIKNSNFKYYDIVQK